MPFGLHGAAASFQKVMDKTLKDIHDCAVAYIDDILVFSENWETHLHHLRKVFQALQQAGLTANRKKSHLGFCSVQYLGFWIGNGQIWAIPDKVATLKAAAQSQTWKELQSFMGLAS